jgi:post-segregation antitoxin (ccd killing protein)
MSDRIVASVKVSPDIWKLAKKYAIDANITLSQLVETALIHEMQKKQL